MSVENDTAAPAGTEQGAIAPEILTVDTAAARMIEADEPDQPSADGAETQPDANVQPNGEEPGKAPGQPNGDGQEASGEETTAETDPSIIDWEKVPGTAKFRLRDGTEFDGAFVKQNLDRLRQVDHIERDLGQRWQQIQQHVGQVAQREQYLAQVLPQAIQVLQQSLPQPPQPPKWNPDDVFGSNEAMGRYLEEKAAYDQRVTQIQQYQREQTRLEQETQIRRSRGIDAYIAQQQQELYRTMPDLRDQAKRQSFMADVYKFGGEYGFEKGEIDNAHDHRLMRMMRDAIEYRKLMSGKPNKAAQQQPATQAAPQQQRPAVAEPGKRTTQAEQTAQRKAELFQRARSRGGTSITDAARLIAELDL